MCKFDLQIKQFAKKFHKSRPKLVIFNQPIQGMAKEKFVYNAQTLQYEKVQFTFQQKLIRSFSFAGALALYTALVVAIAPSSGSNEKAYLKELTELRKRFHDMNTQLEDMSNVLANIHQRDEAIYRQMLNMKSTDESVWNGGRGGSDKYADMRGLSDSELLIATSQKISKLRHQLAVSATSQDEIIGKAEGKQKMLRSMPSIRPIRLLEKEIQYMSGFGYRIHPVFKIKKMHTGIDFGAPEGTPIYATGDGKVVRVEHKTTGYGKNVVVDHGYGYETLYGHMSKIEVKVGQQVTKGEQIGRVGNTGTSTAPHVHYEVIYKGNQVNPLPFVTDGLSPEEYKKLVDNANMENQSLEQ